MKVLHSCLNFQQEKHKNILTFDFLHVKNSANFGSTAE
jgi:hypothetical protein